MKRICVYCGSSRGNREVYREAASSLGRRLAERGLGVVYGGGNVGLMGLVAQAALDAGGEVIGVIPEALMKLEVGNLDLTKLHVVASMHERKALMADLSDGFLALPGGIGTMEEMFETWTWGQLGYHRKPLALLDIAGYFTKLDGFIDHMVEEGFLQPHHRAYLMIGADADALLDRFLDYVPPPTKHWIDRNQT